MPNPGDLTPVDSRELGGSGAPAEAGVDLGGSAVAPISDSGVEASSGGGGFSGSDLGSSSSSGGFFGGADGSSPSPSSNGPIKPSSAFVGATNLEYRDIGLDKIMEDLQMLDHTRLRVGVVGPKAQESASSGRLTLAELAIILEHGSPAMKIPAFHFIGGSLPPSLVRHHGTKVAEAVVSFGNVDHALEEMGRALSEHIRDRIYSNQFGHNKDTTVRKKGFDHPLLETSELADAISYQIVRENGDVLEAGSSDEFAGFQISGGG